MSVRSAKPSADHTALPAVIVGTAVWVITLVLLTVRGPVVPPQDGVWWWGAALMGVLSGAIGLPFLVRRRARMAAGKRADQTPA